MARVPQRDGLPGGGARGHGELALESIQARVESRTAKVGHWKNSEQNQRWFATALLDLEPRLRRMRNYRALPLLREAIKRQMQGAKKSAASTVGRYRISTTNGIDSALGT